MPFKNCCNSGFADRHLESVVNNVGQHRRMPYVAGNWSYTYQQKIFWFFYGERPWLSRIFQVWEELYIMRKTPKHLETDSWGIGYVSFLNSRGSQQIFETRGDAYVYSPRCSWVKRWMESRSSRSRRSIISKVELSRWRDQKSSRSIESIDDSPRSIDDGDSMISAV